MGARNTPFYRVVAADARTATDGRFIENLGWYDPTRSEDNFQLKVERIEYWAQQGAKLSPTVRSLLKKAGKRAAVPPAPQEATAQAPVEEPAASDSPQPEPTPSAS
jgi:small subunit ribosomal protein S16